MTRAATPSATRTACFTCLPFLHTVLRSRAGFGGGRPLPWACYMEGRRSCCRARAKADAGNGNTSTARARQVLRAHDRRGRAKAGRPALGRPEDVSGGIAVFWNKPRSVNRGATALVRSGGSAYSGQRESHRRGMGRDLAPLDNLVQGWWPQWEEGGKLSTTVLGNLPAAPAEPRRRQLDDRLGKHRH